MHRDRVFTQEDPIGLAGGLNLYGYANGDPVNFSDPFGLSCEPKPQCEQGAFNIVKFGVGGVNTMRGIAGVASGAALFTTSTGASVIIGPLALPPAAVGTGKIVFGLANVNRGAGQMSEALNDPNGPSWKNVMGLLPFGQEYDDPGEPTIFEYARDRVRTFVTDPALTIKTILKEFFAIDRKESQ